ATPIARFAWRTVGSFLMNVIRDSGFGIRRERSHETHDVVDWSRARGVGCNQLRHAVGAPRPGFFKRTGVIFTWRPATAGRYGRDRCRRAGKRGSDLRRDPR